MKAPRVKRGLRVSLAHASGFQSQPKINRSDRPPNFLAPSDFTLLCCPDVRRTISRTTQNSSLENTNLPCRACFFPLTLKGTTMLFSFRNWFSSTRRKPIRERQTAQLNVEALEARDLMFSP